MNSTGWEDETVIGDWFSYVLAVGMKKPSVLAVLPAGGNCVYSGWWWVTSKGRPIDVLQIGRGKAHPSKNCKVMCSSEHPWIYWAHQTTELIRIKSPYRLSTQTSPVTRSAFNGVRFVCCSVVGITMTTMLPNAGNNHTGSWSHFLELTLEITRRDLTAPFPVCPHVFFCTKMFLKCFFYLENKGFWCKARTHVCVRDHYAFALLSHLVDY